MDKKILSFFFSTRLMAVLFIVFAAAMGSGTFIENTYNTDTARIWIYNSKWFEGIMLLFVINFLGNIKRYKLYKKEKWATLILHLAFIFIITGAFITRYISYEGMMHIREGATENKMFSDKTYLSLSVDGMYKNQIKRRFYERSLLLSPVTNNDFSMSKNFADKPFEIVYKDFIMGATEYIKPSGTGTTYLKVVEAGAEGRVEHYLKEGEVQDIHNLLFALNKFTKGAININTEGGVTTVSMPFDGDFMRMADKFQGKVNKDSLQQLMFRSLYSVGDARFVFPDAPVKGTKGYKSNNDFKDKKSTDLLVLTVKANGQEREVTLKSTKGEEPQPQTVKLGDLDFTLAYGSRIYTVPFGIKLNDFIASKYPGTDKSYSSYESQVTVVDGSNSFDKRIYMNHVLDYKGFRFFQASFDADEKGTVLSVNHDFWGTSITYAGYFMLFFGLMSIMFTKHSRFADLKRKLDVVKAKKAKLTLLLLLFAGFSGYSQQQPAKHSAKLSAQILDSLEKYKVDEAHAAKFGRLVIQDEGGRMKPVNTFSSELLRKVSKSDTYGTMNSDQVFLSMTEYPTAWFEVPLIYLKSGNDSLRKIIGLAPDAKYAAFQDFFDEKWNYKLSSYLDGAYRAAEQNQFQKDFIEADRKVNLLNSALSGSILRIFPIPNDVNYKWISMLQLHEAGLKGIDSTFTQQILPIYLESLKKAAVTHNYKEADFYLSGISKFQHKYGSKVMPADEKIDSEIFYNKYNIFKSLFFLYMGFGVLMLFFTIVNIFLEQKFMRYVINAFHGIIILLFALHTGGLIMRWYISGHAPWSDAYESMIYVAWATMFFTLSFDRKSKLTVASGTFVASMILMIAHWNWMDPSIANLEPVLNSYWLMIHVAVIVASYGPFTLAMILGAVALILMLFVNEKNRKRMDLHIKEITYINEMSLTIGLIMLTIGNFLGGQWANESWGRYWGWDPKETWALISIMVYAFVIHARFVPALRGKWIYNVFSVVAFYSIMMTYFGVNFYLKGLHSYASGDKVVTPAFVYYSIAIVALLATASWFGNQRLKK
jgi:cytochrome c-type biogenesis protein CcsB